MPCGYHSFVLLSSASQRKPPRSPRASRAANGTFPRAPKRRSRRSSTTRPMRWPGGGSRRSSRSRNGAGSIARSPAAGNSVTRLAWRIVTTREELPIRRNTLLLSASLAANSGMLQLSAAVASLTLVTVLGVKGLLGLGPAIVLASGALAALPAGRAMDRSAACRCSPAASRRLRAAAALAALGSAAESAPAVLAGLIGVGAASGTALLARTAAGDMYPPEHRAHGIALVLFGAVFGAILGPLVFSPLLSGRELDGDTLALLWLAAGGFMRRRAARSCCSCGPTRSGSPSCCTPTPTPRSRARPRRCARSSRRPGVIPALLAGQAELRGDGGRDDADRLGRRRPPAPRRPPPCSRSSART